ncbi:MAG TPA: hypothetical protein VG873_14305 [Burkholderiales bacterium]|nr:hypothetical protein [Burkholderiales bacterium]
MSAVRLLAAALAGALAGCALLPSEAPSTAVQACRDWYAEMDAAIDAAGVRDAQETRIASFPYLRIDRAHAALRDRAATSEAALHAFADALLDLDLRARRLELRNLARSANEAQEAFQRSVNCGRLLRELDVAKPERRSALLAAARVPDDYSGAARAAGLYPLTRIPFIRGVRQWEAEVRAAFAGARRGEDAVVRYAPPAGPEAPSRGAVAAMLARAAAADPLGRPRLSEREVREVALAYAPSFEVEVRADYDRFGALRWRRGAGVPEVDGADLAVYIQAAYTRYADGPQDRILLQLVYTLWFPERPPLEEGDLLAGRLDGLVWRVTLAPDGEPLLYDAMHPCGCYHMFFPTPRAVLRPAPDPAEEWAFVPAALPRVAPGERPRLRLASATHALEGVALVRGADSLVRYELRDYDELRSLRRLDGSGHRSAFGPDGLVAGTERAERFLFWPMGIRSAGAMRQWGRHATAFVGRRHFDDADLVARRFALDLGDRR